MLSQPSLYSLFQSDYWKHNNVWNLFRFNNKDTRARLVVSFCGVFIINLEKILTLNKLMPVV